MFIECLLWSRNCSWGGGRRLRSYLPWRLLVCSEVRGMEVSNQVMRWIGWYNESLSLVKKKNMRVTWQRVMRQGEIDGCGGLPWGHDRSLRSQVWVVYFKCLCCLSLIPPAIEFTPMSRSRIFWNLTILLGCHRVCVSGVFHAKWL